MKTAKIPETPKGAEMRAFEAISLFSIKAAERKKVTVGILELLLTFRRCLSCEDQDEFRAAFFTLAVQVARELGDEQTIGYIESRRMCNELQTFEEEGR